MVSKGGMPRVVSPPPGHMLQPAKKPKLVLPRKREPAEITDCDRKRQKNDTDSLVSHIAESIKPQVMEEILPVIIKTFEPKIADLVSQATLLWQEHMITEFDSRVAQISHSQPNAFDDEMSKRIRTDVLRSLGQALTQLSEQ